MEPSLNARQTLPPIHTVLGDQLRLPTSVSHSPHSSSSYASFYTCEDGSERVEPSGSSALSTKRSPTRPRAFTIPMPPLLTPSPPITSFPQTYSLPTTPVPSSPNISEGRSDNVPIMNAEQSRKSPQSAPPFSYSVLRPSPSGELVSAPQIMRGRRTRKTAQTAAGSLTSRRHICSICQKSFNRPSSLQTHLSVHTGLRPFECLHPSCTKVFSVASNMRRHFRKHHSQRETVTNNAHRHALDRMEWLGSSDGEDDAEMEVRGHPSSVVPQPSVVRDQDLLSIQQESTVATSTQFDHQRESSKEPPSNVTYCYRR